MHNFELHPKLQQDSHLLGRLTDCYLLLSKNALYPWFILVPQTEETEFYRLPAAQQQAILGHINRLSEFLHQSCAIDKLNIATLGNVVAQLHIHVIGRRHDDACWPQAVWGHPQFKAYTSVEVAALAARLAQALGPALTPQTQR